MSSKSKVIFSSEARSKMLNGVRAMADTVTVTLGPRGQNVGIAYGDKFGNIYQRVSIHDGVSVSRCLDLADEFENFGAQLLKQAAQKQVQDCGDGTTVAVLLGRAILDQVNVLISNGVNPMELRSSLEKYIEAITKSIDKLSTKVTNYQQKEYIATVSAEDEELGKMVAKVVDEIGVDGLVAVEESNGANTTVEHQEGMQIEKG
jgi:chaperonin GroEL